MKRLEAVDMMEAAERGWRQDEAGDTREEESSLRGWRQYKEAFE